MHHAEDAEERGGGRRGGRHHAEGAMGTAGEKDHAQATGESGGGEWVVF